ncbi:MAG: class I SAM-dependent methyltransferase [Candidatus Coatesbacteria bacterium]
MSRKAREEIWAQEEREPFAGWDFSHLKGRMLEDEPPWSYRDLAADRMRGASSLVDIGTGGGERLLEMRDAWPAKVAATEEYPPNFKLATERLAPLGVRVVNVSESPPSSWPFADGEFDLVLNRHSAINAPEIARVLAPGCTFLTRQVHGMWGHDLLAVFGAKPQWPWATPKKYVPDLVAAGLKVVDVKEWEGRLVYTDIGAIVYHLKAVPWMVPGFSVKDHLEALLALQARLDSGQPLSFFAALYLIEARKA